MKTAYTANQKAIIRTHPQTTQYSLAIHTPIVMALGTLSTVPTAYPGNSLSITNLQNILGGFSLSSIKRGMTVWFGSEGARYDVGALRVRKNYSGNSLIEVSEFGSGLINFTSATCMSFVDDYRMWAIHPSYDTATSRWRVDLDPYTSQTKAYGPQVIMGPPAVLQVGSNGKTLASYVGNLSLQHSGSITSQTWTFPDGQTVTSALGSSQNPIVITYLNSSTQGGIHTLQVTDSNGASHIGQRLTFAFGSGVKAQSLDCRFDQITGGYRQGGYRTRIYVGETATSKTVENGAKVVIFENACYGTRASSIGGNYFARDNIVLVGRVINESQRIEPFTGELSFEIETEDSEMKRAQSYDIFLESGSAASDWDMASALTIDRAGIVLAKYRSTIANVVDFNPASGMAATNEIPYRDLAQGSLWDQMNYNYQAAGFGLLSFDLQGNLWAMLDTQVTGTSSTLPTIMDIGAGDRRDVITIDHEHRDTTAQYLIYAITGGAYNPIAAWSPGDRSGYFGQRQEVSRNLTAADQDTLITWTGNKRAQDNNPYKRITIPLVGNNRIDPVPQSLITMSLSAAQHNRGFTWTNRNLIPYEINISYDAEKRYTNVELIAETVVNGIGGSAFTFPTGASIVSPPAPPPVPNTCPPGQHWDAATQTCKDDVVGIGDQNTVYVATYQKLARTRNFLNASPNWTDITPSFAGTIIDFELDAFDPVNRAYLLTSTNVYFTRNLNASTPTFTSIFDLTSFTVSGVTTLSNFRRLTSIITAQGVTWVGWEGENSSTARRSGAVRIVVDTTIPSVTSWTSVNCDTNNGAGATSYVLRIVEQFNNSNIAYYQCNGLNRGKLYSVTLSGGSLTSATVYDPGAFESQSMFDAAYPDSDQTMYAVHQSGGTGYVMQSTNGGSSFSQVTTFSITGASSSQNYNRIMNIATANKNDIILADNPGNTETGYVIRSSVDGGVNWSAAITVGGVVGAITALGRWPFATNTLFWLGDSIYYSTDRATIQDKIGDWVAVLGVWPTLGTGGVSGTCPIMIIPVWLSTS